MKGWGLGAITLFLWFLGLGQVGGEPEEVESSRKRGMGRALI